MQEPMNEKPVMQEPKAEYGLQEAVMDTNAAIQKLAGLIGEFMKTVSSLSVADSEVKQDEHQNA